MTYHVLARKWRPQTFADLVGQTHVKKALTFALSQNQVHHAYLFTGTRGVGKTSIARIFAKSLNCEVNGVSANPCGECESCREIKAGKFVDLIEVDAASRTGVEETRELIDSVAYLPTKGRFKVYLIDEVHMFSKSSFNALLKTLEEPPEHVKFILATTDPEKLPITILSRCLQFNLKSLTTSQICQHLANICQSESIHYEEEALSLLAKAGDGSMRDTLSMTDQAIAYGQGELNIAAVTEILGTIQPADIEAILFAIATNNPNQLSTALHRLDDYEVDARAFLIEIMKRLQRMAWAKEGIVEQLSPALLSTVNDIPKPLLHLWYDIAEKALPNLSLSGDPREAVEMALLRMLAFIPDDWVVRHRTLLSTNETVADIERESHVHHGADENTAETKLVSPSTTASAQETVADTSRAAAVSTQNTTQKTTEIGTKVHAEPVPESQDLLEAEARFNGEAIDNASQETHQEVNQETQFETAAEVVASDERVTGNVQATDEQPENVSEQADKHASQADEDALLEQVPVDQSTVESQWHLSEEADDEPAPSMEELQTLMQPARNIKSPEPKVTPVQEEPESTETEPKEIQSEEIQSEELEPEEAIVKTAKVVDEHLQPQSTEDIPPWETSAEDSKNNNWQKKVEAFDWFEELDKLSLSEFTQHFVSLGLLDLMVKDEHVNALFSLAPKHEIMMTEETLSELKQALADYFGVAVNLETQLIDLHSQTPSDLIAQQEAQTQSDLFAQFEGLPAVQEITQALDAKIIERTIKQTSGEE